MRRRTAWHRLAPTRRRAGSLGLGALTVSVVFAFGVHPAAGVRPTRQLAIHGATIHTGVVARTVVLDSAAHSIDASGTAAGGADGTGTSGPVGIQVGPSTTTTTSPASGGGTVSTGTQPSPGLFDITGHIEAAIDGWFSDLVTSALNPVLTVLGHTLLATPDVTAEGRVVELWRTCEGIADALLVLFVLVGAAIVMGNETLQTRTALKDIAPRIVVAAIAVNASLSLAGLAISSADSLSQAVLGQGVDPAQATVVLRQLILGSLADGGIFIVLLGGVVAGLAIVLLATFVVRLALVVLLVVAAPLALVCHALPQSEVWPRCGGGPSAAPWPSRWPSRWYWSPRYGFSWPREVRPTSASLRPAGWSTFW